MNSYHSAAQLGYVHYPIKKDYVVPVSYAPTCKHSLSNVAENIFSNKLRQYDNEDRPMAFKPVFSHQKEKGSYDPYFKVVVSDHQLICSVREV
jgi:hypothetical protein